jgi:hypothetical protein
VVMCGASTRVGRPCRNRGSVAGRCWVHARGAAEEAGLVAVVEAAAAAGDWRAAAWVLERRFPERWVRPAQRQEERPAAAEMPDGLDELAGRRDARRGAR